MPLPHPQTLQKLEVPIIDSEVCSRLYWRGAGQGAITEDMLCAGYLQGQRDACLVSAPPSSHLPESPGPRESPRCLCLAQAPIRRAIHRSSTERLGGAGPHSLGACLLLRGFLRPGPQSSSGSLRRVARTLQVLLPGGVLVWLGGRERGGLAQSAPHQH